MIWNWRILCYHMVDREQRDAFAAQLRWFRGRGHVFTGFREAFAARKTLLGPPRITVSFDDADSTICTVAQEVLAEEGIKAILYLTTDYVLRANNYRDTLRRPTVDWAKLGRWLDAGHEIGGHTHTHADATQISTAQWQDELDASRQCIKRELGVDVVHFAYPWGRHDKNVQRWFQNQSQWRSAATVNGRGNGPCTNPFTLGRSSMTAEWDEARMRLLIQPARVRILNRMVRVLGQTCGKFRPRGK